MALYLGNDEVSQRINLASVKGTNLPEISEETSGMFLSNDGENIAWSEVETTVDTVLNGWSLFDYKFSDHILEDESWTRSDSFDWKDGTIYTSAYEHLLADYNSGEEKYDYRASNINVIGELTNEKGVLSGFSASNYASINTLTPFNPGSNPWEISFKLNLSETQFNDGETILSYGDTFPIIHLGLTSWGSFSIQLSSNGSDYDIADTTSMGYGLSSDENVVVKLRFTGSQYTLSYSKNNGEFQTDITIDSTQPIFNSDALIYLGCQGSAGKPFTGSIDLNECYININDLEWWKGADAIKYKLSADGHKICDYIQENAIQSVYELNGVAWYYIIDTVNSKFKLPRSKWNFVGLRNEVGTFVDESLPNITGTLYSGNVTYQDIGLDDGIATGAIQIETDSNPRQASENVSGSDNYNLGWSFDASRSSSAYQDSALVQQRATEMYLYFYVGDVVRNTSIINITQFGDRMIEVENAVADVESTVEQHIEEVNTTISEYKEEVNTTVANIESSVGDKLDTTQITNCITEIPQDIKLELVDGVLTLKAGSKVYVPNGKNTDGSNKFDVVTVPSDVSFHSGTIGTYTTHMMLCCNLTGGYGNRAEPLFFESGTTAPSDTTHYWYDTTNNMVKGYENGSWVQKYSLPIGIYYRENGNAVSIDQVFNGFGYIGSTVYVLPGVKGLIPNGRNADGSLKNIEFTVSSVLTRTFTWDISGLGQFFAISTTGLTSSGTNIPFYQQEETPPVKNFTYWYKPSENIMYSTGSGTTWYKTDLWVVGQIVGDNTGKITSFTQKTTFHAVDCNDTSFITDQSFPSNKYMDITLKESQAEYTAPANGWVSVAFTSSAVDQEFSLDYRGNNDTWLISSGKMSYKANEYIRMSIPVSKNGVYSLKYDGGTCSRFRFTYANGVV